MNFKVVVSKVNVIDLQDSVNVISEYLILHIILNIEFCDSANFFIRTTSENIDVMNGFVNLSYLSA